MVGNAGSGAGIRFDGYWLRRRWGGSNPTPAPAPSGGNGTFTVTDIPATYNGKYVMLQVQDNNLNLMGCQTFNMQEDSVTLTLSQVSGGSVSIPVWDETGKRYSGNANVVDGTSSIAILGSQTLTLEYEEGAFDDTQILAAVFFDGVKFTNGSATVSWEDGEEMEP